MAISIDIDGISRNFDGVKALDDIQLDIKAGEFFTLLGSSGSGKSTLLRIIAGFDQPTNGSIRFDGKNILNVPASKRSCNTVFQDLALFPHMTVEENIGYGLKVRKEPAAQRQRKVKDILELVDLGGYGDRKIAMMSGGQRQRVALARALVMEPGILLLDEPLTGLDERLRQQMRDEFSRLHKKTGATFILVTHNQDEALSLSDRMAIMHLGKLEQVGTPDEFLNHPQNEFVAKFVGLETILTPSNISVINDNLEIKIADQKLTIPNTEKVENVTHIAVRSDRILVAANDGNGLNAKLISKNFRGRTYECVFKLSDGQKITANIAIENFKPEWKEGTDLTLEFEFGALIPIGKTNNKRA
ncbi:MAG: ABC transporter ATP-binding protein [Alphaproteobacteria bacterium]|nr:ABC transporter ATP-binding protein [Alphaproteobacteria bacterium]